MAKKRKQKVTAVIGAQYGSEGKGIVVNHIADQYDVHVRVGAPNAGHTFWYEGTKEVMQSVPCGWTNRNAQLIIGAGALIDMDILERELRRIHALYDPNILSRVFIDPMAGIISKWHSDEEGGTAGEMHHRIGSTGKGVGAARRDRVMRNPASFRFFKDVAFGYVVGVKSLDVCMCDTVDLLSKQIKGGASVLLEGAQGSGLSLIHGPWPYVTSTDTNAAQMCADVGLPPQAVTDVLLVARTYPIRVAGTSGPLVHELDWDYISDRMGRPVQEITTVTKKVRRIGQWEEALFGRAVVLNGAKEAVLTFMDYLSPQDEGQTDWQRLHESSIAFIEYVEAAFDVRVPFIVTGGQDFPHVCDIPARAFAKVK